MGYYDIYFDYGLILGHPLSNKNITRALSTKNILSPKNINDLLFGTQYHNKETLRDAHIEFGVIPYHQC